MRSKKINPDQKIFIRTLQWASDRGPTGFSISELKAATTTSEEEWTWVKRMFLGEINGEPALIYHDGVARDGGYRYFLTGSGATVLMDYLELKQARESAKSAMRWATASLLLAAFVGFIQIAIGLAQLYMESENLCKPTPIDFKG
jgi:hypothetical protein